MNTHMNSVIDHGRDIIGVGGAEVIVTASELSDVYVESCK